VKADSDGSSNVLKYASTMHKALAVTTSSYRQISLYRQGSIQFSDCAANIGMIMAEEVVLKYVQAHAAAAVTGVLGLSFTEPVNNFAAGLLSPNVDIDWNDVAEIALFCVAVDLVCKGVQKLWDKATNQYGKFNRLLAEQHAITAAFYNSMVVDHREDISAAMEPTPQMQACIRECEALDRMLRERGEKKPLSWYFLAEKRSLLGAYRTGSEKAAGSLTDHMWDTLEMINLYGDMVEEKIDLKPAKQRFVEIRRTPEMANFVWHRVNSLEVLKCLAAQRSEKFANTMFTCFGMSRFEDVAALAGELQAKTRELEFEIAALKARKKL
ncbi:MAG: hypothetical protein Q4F72_06075, partial [Desulfovibrionaceae bacterium]|nr:hypothetical protein [Desulfovibrionaceae bacterium]